MRRAREAVARERAQRGEDHGTDSEDQRREADIDDVEDAMRDRDESRREG